MLDLTNVEVAFTELRQRGRATKAVQIHEPFIVRTVDETLRGEPGDWLCEDAQGHRFVMTNTFFTLAGRPEWKRKH